MRPQLTANALPWWQTVLGLALFAFIGSSLILAEKIVPQRFPPQTDAQLLAELQTMPAVRENEDLAETLSHLPVDSNLRIIKGRALYPRYYGQDEVEPDTRPKRPTPPSSIRA